ncbi:hypothetical protein SMGD1_0965 [Sulfurimonas gotlandica GD1]|jgi:hypothetical protein|uniref:Lipoprotein n=1 Tax=Sulfurimonas gotlandica (strain DSM 19862 / JCM 16533 / GD1) TaxID=929558 RepID=B6BLT7_SULGG|nr:hypothetical protein [Sulfurimonas gotlandica]EDZ61712.1 conserved hypothetical protein [Sulfurimonas gotlandica GD1]EHP29491.1 hypothetical protein SMGD1_0965 [Sulfurimonas gotlandica GD1]
MIRITILSLSLLFLSACSFKSPPNQWQYKSTAAFDSYTKNFLSSNDSLARNDLNRAIEHAKQSADLTMLARVYLGKCALNISVGVKDSCQEYQNISTLVDDKSLYAYYSFITLMPNASLVDLNAQYKDFALHLNKKDFTKANNELLKISKHTSKLLCASLMKEKLSNTTRDEMIKTASFYGYKKSVLFWLNELKTNTTDEETRKNISKKMFILESKDEK